ncbi:hypothetical protein EYF80_041546 [Liparis tanakae]|uniref:Uncharacterized protein n=1 Tax=Liparis tanakae TaxID=230148 RepID=A0A4Z2G3X3_9TELE|nr:hypothetical protein EYF80_041546 [Liparis tanakae]
MSFHSITTMHLLSGPRSGVRGLDPEVWTQRSGPRGLGCCGRKANNMLTVDLDLGEQSTLVPLVQPDNGTSISAASSAASSGVRPHSAVTAKPSFFSSGMMTLAVRLVPNTPTPGSMARLGSARLGHFVTAADGRAARGGASVLIRSVRRREEARRRAGRRRAGEARGGAPESREEARRRAGRCSDWRLQRILRQLQRRHAQWSQRR